MELYGLLPTLVLAGLAIFPLSAIEILIYSLPVLGIAAWGMMETGEGLALTLNGPTYWFMAMTMGVAMISGMSQSHYMESLVHHATTDPLTGILTRRAGMEALEHHMMDSIAQGRPLAVFFLDLDHFKQVNDSFGHDAGDQALVSFVHALRNIFRRDDILIRWGGEEFIILIPGMAITAVPALLNKMRTHGVGRRVDGRPLQVSIGVAERQYDGASDWAVLVSLADQRMYRAKQQGRARAVLPDGGVVQIAMRN